MPGSFRPHKGCIGGVKVTFSERLETGSGCRSVGVRRHKGATPKRSATDEKIIM